MIRPQPSTASTGAALVLALALAALCLAPAAGVTLAGCTVNGATRIVESCPLTLTTVNLEDADISGFAADAFGEPQGTDSALQHLRLARSALRELPAGLFANTPDLRSLDVTETGIRSIPEGLLDSTPQLEALDVSVNKLTTLPLTLLDGLQNIHTLKMGSLRGLEQLPSLENCCREVTSLSLSSMYSLKSLPDNFLQNQQKLERLTITNGYSLESFGTNMFPTTNALTRVHLSGGLVDNLPAGVFNGLTGVTTLHLQDFYKLQAFPANVFAQMSSLKLLRLDDVGVRAIHPDAFTGLGSLESLVSAFLWNNNRFADDSFIDCDLALPDNVFAPLTSMTTLDFGAPCLTYVGASALPLGFSGSVTITAPKLKGLHKDAFAGASVTSVELVADHLSTNGGRQFTDLPAAVFAPLSSTLTSIIVRGYHGKALPSGLLQGDVLTSIDIEGALLTSFPPGMFSANPQLSSITLEVPFVDGTWFTGLPSALRSITLHTNAWLIPADTFADVSSVAGFKSIFIVGPVQYIGPGALPVTPPAPFNLLIIRNHKLKALPKDVFANYPTSGIVMDIGSFPNPCPAGTTTAFFPPGSSTHRHCECNEDGATSTYAYCMHTVCGDGVVQSFELCDDGNTADGDGCSSLCTPHECGNGVLETGEECDDGNNDDSDGCSSECATLACGDGVVHGSEECDDGNSASGDGCSAACTAEFCGDGIVNNGEDCDDGNTDDEDGCWTTCIAPRCGDGIVSASVGEECDSGLYYDPLCRADCTSFTNPPTYSATWGTDHTPATSGGTITEPIIHFTASYSLFIHRIAATSFDVRVGGQPVPTSAVALLTDESTPTKELVISVALGDIAVGASGLIVSLEAVSYPAPLTPSPFTLLYLPPQASLLGTMPDRNTVVADLTFTGAAVQVVAKAFTIVLPDGLTAATTTLLAVGNGEGNRARHWRLTLGLQGEATADGSVSIGFTGVGCYPPSLLPGDAVIPVDAASAATLTAASVAGAVLDSGVSVRLSTIVYEVTFPEPSTFTASDLVLDVAGNVVVRVDDVTVTGARATVTVSLVPTASGAYGLGIITAHVPYSSAGVSPLTSGSNPHSITVRPPVPTLTASFDGTSRILSVLATFRDSASPSSDPVPVAGVTVADFSVGTTGAVQVISSPGAVTVQPVGNSVDSFHYTAWRLDMVLALPLNTGSVVVGISAASGNISPVPTHSAPAELEIPVGGPVPTLSTTGFNSGDSVQGPFRITATYSAPVTGVDARNFHTLSFPSNGVLVSFTVSPAPTAVSSQWVVEVSVTGASANGAAVYVHMTDVFDNVSPLPGSAVNSPIHVTYSPNVACASQPCLHGACVPTGDSDFTCQCFPGFSGTLCDEAEDACAGVTACNNNGGVCVANGNGPTWRCECLPGVTGATCEDACPNNPSKTSPGECGCDVADTDADGDGTPDCNDGCPSDVNKLSPGTCGCGASDVDSDGDGAADCTDDCPADASKTAPGTCGCGVADTDSDSDGTADCTDGCPADASKTAPGTCGCGVSDTDSDSDGTADCTDGCPADASKTAPGTCGCGVSDTDANGNGLVDCVDPCSPNPCLNGGVCSVDQGAPTCDCGSAFAGDTCEEVTGCDGCVGDEGPCRHVNDGSCYSYLPGTSVCPPGTTQCAPVTDVDDPVGECGGCYFGTSGPCKNPANTVCYGYQIPATQACPPNTIACTVVAPASSGEAGVFSLEVAGVSADSMDGGDVGAVVSAAAASMGVDESSVSVTYVVPTSGGTGSRVGFVVTAPGVDGVAAAGALTASVRDGQFQLSLVAGGVASAGVSDLVGTAGASTSAGLESGTTAASAASSGSGSLVIVVAVVVGVVAAAAVVSAMVVRRHRSTSPASITRVRTTRIHAVRATNATRSSSAGGSSDAAPRQAW